MMCDLGAGKESSNRVFPSIKLSVNALLARIVENNEEYPFPHERALFKSRVLHDLTTCLFLWCTHAPVSSDGILDRTIEAFTVIENNVKYRLVVEQSAARLSSLPMPSPHWPLGIAPTAVDHMSTPRASSG